MGREGYWVGASPAILRQPSTDDLMMTIYLLTRYFSQRDRQMACKGLKQLVMAKIFLWPGGTGHV